MNAGDFLAGADDTGRELAARGDLCPRPQNGVFEDCLRTDTAILIDKRASAQLCACIDNRILGNAHRPFRRRYVGRLPALLRDRAMNLQILRSRSNVEPFVFIKNRAANSTALPNPFHQNRDKGNFFGGRDSLKDLRVPHGNVGIVVSSGRAASAFNVDDPAISENDARAEMGFPERQSDIVSRAKMLFDQWLRRRNRGPTGWR